MNIALTTLGADSLPVLEVLSPSATHVFQVRKAAPPLLYRKSNQMSDSCNQGNRKELVQAFLVQLGNVVCKQRYHGYLDPRSIWELCKEHHICIEGRILESDALEEMLRRYIGNTEAVAFDGICIYAWYRGTHWYDELLLKFERYDATGHGVVLPSDSNNSCSSDVKA